MLVEKRTRSLEQIDSYVLGIHPVKKSKNDNKKEYFEISFQSENSQVKALCFPPEKWSRLKKYQSESTSCLISNALKENSDYKLTNSMTGKPKTLVFAKSENCKYHSIDEVINKLQPYNYVNVIVNVTGMSKINKIRNLSLKEFLVTTDDGVTFINITMFEDLISLL